MVCDIFSTQYPTVMVTLYSSGCRRYTICQHLGRGSKMLSNAMATVTRAEDPRDRIAEAIAGASVEPVRLHRKRELRRRLCEFARLKSNQQEQPPCSNDS